ncbi:centrosomal protein of 290 kDa-like isoform X1 [Lethenteron reissneri]|uniref:centrosomal protein of 290 kDa-like isoform X1 n=1 Tax=Lethenteron reissneri TaxID=7753 RepID=UPI002AB6B276|nr:centrosomal protein of 290 kDa-like isoform X1 [Lethenteron reissneri]XP_061435034.1 centrosomal protein of 290 kDa-like isoform X1 [Lethenteron reissneri]
MAPNVAWEILLKCDPNTLEREVDVAYQIEDIISKVEVKSLKDETSDKLIHLFSLTQSLMQLKSQEAAFAMEEVERAGTEQAKVERQYKAKIDKLQNELTQVPGRGGRNASLMRGEIQELEQNLERRDQELAAVEQNLEKEKKWSEQLSKKMEEAEGEISKLKRENDILRQDIVDYQRQMDSQRESKRSRTEDGADLKAQISRMKREMMEYLDDIQNLTETNERLVTQAQQLQKELEQSAVDMERMAEEYAQMRVLVQQSDLVVDQLRRDKEHLALQVQELNTLLQVRSEEDDPIMQAVNSKIEEWKSLLVGKDEELLEYQKRVRDLQERLKATQLDSDKQSIVALQQALQVREQQVELLAEQMGQHTAEMERNAAVMEEMRDQLQQHQAAPSSQAFQNSTLRGRLAELEGRLRQAEEVARAADADAAEKDRQLIDALARMRQYEAGEYGLVEAVADIKVCQQQVRTRDGTVETLTRDLNALEMRLNDMLDENDELRSRLGLESKSVVDLTEIRKNKALTQQRYRAENQVLLKEIERLEEERLTHKKQIRKLAQDRGQRAASIGLLADDLNLSDDLAEGGTTSKKSESVWTKADMERLSRKVEQLCQELEHREKELAEKSKEGASLRHQVSELQAEVSGLEAGLREVSAAVRAAQSAPGGPGGPGVGAGGGGGGGSTAIHLPSLERLLTVLEARRSGGPHEGVAQLKEQLAQLTGRNQELRDELRATRSEALAASSTKDRAFDKMSRLEGELALLRTSGATGTALPTLPLPEAMVPSSSDVINALNEYLVQVLQDNSGKDAELERVSESLEQLKRKFAVACHQQSLLYQDFHSEREEWQKERERLDREKLSLEEKNQENSIHVQEYNNLLEASKLDAGELTRKLSEMSRRMTVLRVNELALSRRHAALVEAESHGRRENARLHADVTDMEAAVAERIGYLQRYKDMASYKIAALQKALADSVPASELEVANGRYNELTAKYRDLLQRDNVLAQRASSVEHVKEENTALRAEVTMVSKELEICKEKLHTLEQANERIAKQGFTTSAVGTGAGDADESVSRRLTVLEMRELNERQRAEHALHMQRHAEEALARAHERNQQLEEKFAQLTRMNLEAQRVEAELRDELAGGVSRAVSEADRRQIRQLEESQAALRMEVSKQRDVAEVARAQAESWASRQHSHEKEVESLRRQLSDLQCRSDEKTLLGTLHQHIMALQLSEATALRKLETARAKLSRAEAWGLRLEQQLDQREQTLIHARAEGHSRAGHLRRALQALRHRYAGAVPLAEQERFHRTLAQLQDDEMTAAEEARKCREDRRLAEDRLAELEIKSKGLEELVSTLKDARGAQKVCEWHRRMQELRVSERRTEREATRHRDEASRLRAAVEEHERSRSLLEHEILQLNKFHEESQLAWEQRELELEKQVEAHERQQKEMLSAARKFEEVGGTVPDTGLPVAQQLEKAITTIRGHVKTILQSQAQCRSLEEQLQQKQDALHSAEANVLSRERVINELRLRLPASAQREKLLAAAAAAADGGGSSEGGGALVATQRAVANLQARLDHKEQLVDKYQRQLQQAQQELEELNRQHGEEMKAVHHKLNAQSNATFSKFKQAVLETLNSRPAVAVAPASAAQLTRLAELEQTSVEQEEAMVALAERLRATVADAQRHKVQLLQQLTEHRAETAKLQQLHSSELRAERARAEEARASEAALAEELRLLRVELDAQKEANSRSPTAGIRSLVERLKGELAYKEKQLKGLSQAMLRLQGEMTNQAEQNIIAAAAQKEESLNVQTLVDKHTKDYKARLESAQLEASAARRELGEWRQRERELCERLEAAEREARRGDREGGRLRAGKEEAERGRDEMRRRVERINAQLQKGVDGAGRQTQVEELQGRVKRLEQELEKKAAQLEETQQRAERAAAKEDKAEPKEQVIRWEEGKRWQAKVEALRGKLRDKEKEVEALTKQVAAIRDSIARDAVSRRTQDRGVTTGHVLAARAQEEASRAQQLQDTNRQLEDTITSMRQRAALSKEAAVEELLLQNRRLQERLRLLERSATPSSNSRLDQEQEVQRRVLELSDENVELRFELERVRKDLPRLQDKLSDLQALCAQLKREKGEMERKLGNVRGAGRSGKTVPELEKTVGLMQRVVEKLQRENEELRRAPGVVEAQRSAGLEADNAKLKAELQALRLKAGQQLSDRYETRSRGVDKLITENEKLLAHIKREREAVDKLRGEKRSLELALELAREESESSRRRLAEVEAQLARTQASDEQGLKPGALSKLYEARLRDAQEETERACRGLEDARTLLRQAEQREGEHRRRQRQLEQQVELLKKFPEEAKSQPGLTREFQIARLTIDRLEKEKAELGEELEQLRKSEPSSERDVLQKARRYDELLQENVQVQVQLREMKMHNGRLEEEVRGLRKELESFDPAFFEEIEDLKFNYKEAVKRNLVYEEQLLSLGQQFGITVAVPANVSVD